MNKYIILLGFLCGLSANAQVGVNTTNPQQVFHIDGKSSSATINPASGAPTSVQQLDDVVVTKQGFIGIGTTTPSTRVEINSSTAGAIKIVDGTEGDRKVLISDANGVGTWQMPSVLKETVKGTFYRDPSSNAEIPTTSDDSGVSYKYLNADIKLTKGKWIVFAGNTLKSNIANGDIVWTHIYLSSSKSNSSIDHVGFDHLGPAKNNTSYAGQLHGFRSATPNGPDNDNFLSGASLINVTVDNLTLYLMIENQATTVNGVNTGRKWHTTSGFWENYFYAIPIN